MSDPVRKRRNKASNDWLIGQQVDRYHILHRLAAGGMGAVYVARAMGMGGFERLVAIKVLHPHLAEEEEFISMLLDEARLAARIRHPNVVATVDVSQWEDLHYLVMDYVEGDHLAGLLSRPYKAGERLPLRPALKIVFEALAGLSAAHELKDSNGSPLNLVHRDVSPQNILVGVDGISRLTDFGVAKAEYRLSSTRQGTFKGKLAYTAPETASQAHAEQRSDLFALGIVLWEVITTRRLFKAETNVATLRKLLEDPIPPPSSIHEELEPFDAVLAKALARPLEERFQTGAEMMEAIEVAAAETVGMGTTREVAALVRDLAAQKLEKEQNSIRAAIDRLGGESPKAYSTGRHDAIDDQVPSQPPTVSAKIDDIAGLPVPLPSEGRSPVVYAVAAIVAVVLAVGITLLVTSGSDPDPEDLDDPGDTVIAADPIEPVQVVDDDPVDPEIDMAGGDTAMDEGDVSEMQGMDTEETALGAPDEEETSMASSSTRRGMGRGMGMGMRPRMQPDDDDVLSNPYRN